MVYHLFVYIFDLMDGEIYILACSDHSDSSKAIIGSNKCPFGTNLTHFVLFPTNSTDLQHLPHFTVNYDINTTQKVSPS